MAANQGAGAAAKAAAAAAKKLAKPAALGAAAWVAKTFGDKFADEGYNSVKARREKAAGVKAQEALAQDLCRSGGWKYQRFIVDHASGSSCGATTRSRWQRSRPSKAQERRRS
jgi:hypothetical protein